jgi:hypothetical protein
MQDSATHQNAPDRPRQRYRRKYVIDPAFQWKYALTAAAMVLMLSFLISAVQYGVLHQQARLRVMNPGTYHAEVALVIVLFGAAFGSLSALAVTIWCIRISHRVAGPLFVLERYLRELQAGRFPKVRPLRRKDEFKHVHRTLADAVESLKAIEDARMRDLARAVQTAKSLAGQVQGEAGRELDKLVTSLEAAHSAAADRLGVKPLPDSNPAGHSEASQRGQVTAAAGGGTARPDGGPNALQPAGDLAE